MGLSVSQSRTLKQMSASKRENRPGGKQLKHSAQKEKARDKDKENQHEPEQQIAAVNSVGETSWGKRGEKEESNFEKKMMGGMKNSLIGRESSQVQSQKKRRAADREIELLPPTPTFAHSSSKTIPSSTLLPRYTRSLLPPSAGVQPPPFHVDISSVHLDPNSKASRLLEESSVSATKPPPTHQLAPAIVIKNVRGEEISRMDWQIQEEHTGRATLPKGVLMSNKFAEDHRYVQEQPTDAALLKSRRQIMREVMAGRRIHPDQNFQMGSLCGGEQRSLYGKLGLCSELSY